MCERFACLMVSGTSTRDLGGGKIQNSASNSNDIRFYVVCLIISSFFLFCELIFVYGSVIPSPDGKRSMMNLAQRMVKNFCASIGTSNGQRWTTLSGLNEVGVRVTVHKSTDPGQPNGVVLSAATTIWLPISPQDVFNFFKDERTRSQVRSFA